MKLTRRTVALLGVAGLLWGASLWLQRSNAEHRSVTEFQSLLRAALREKRAGDAFELLERANRLDPAGATLRIATFTSAFDPYWTREFREQAYGARFLEAHAAPPGPPTPAPEPFEDVALQGQPAIVMVEGPAGLPPFAEAIPEYLTLLGWPSVDTRPASALDALAGDTVLWVPADEGLSLGEGPARRFYLGPNLQAEAALGLQRVSPEPAPAMGCEFVSQSPWLDPAAGEGLSIYLPVAFTRYKGARGQRPLAVARCGAQEFPLIIESEDGRTLLFAFDLARALIYWRQGDPAEANQENDGSPGLRPSDLFTHPRTRSSMHVPHADVLMRGLARRALSGGPSLRLWPHPGKATGTLVITSDQDDAGLDMVRFMVHSLRQQGHPMTLFLTHYNPEAKLKLRADFGRMLSWLRSWDVDTGIHPDYRGVQPDDSAAFIIADAKAFRQRAGDDARTGRFHYVRWWGWDEPVLALAKVGRTWDLTYITLLSRQHPALGYMTGSGVGLRHFDRAGRPIEVRQLATQIDDHPNPMSVIDALDDAVRVKTFDEFSAMAIDVERSAAERYHGVLALNHHPQHFAADPRWMQLILRAAAEFDMQTTDMRGHARWVEGLLHSQVKRVGDDTFDVLIQNRDQWLLVDEAAARVVVDDAEAKLENVRRYGQPYRMVPVSRGRHRVRIVER